MYLSPSQTRQVFSNDIETLQVLLDKISAENPFSIIPTGDFNARSPIFWEEESVQKTEGKAI